MPATPRHAAGRTPRDDLAVGHHDRVVGGLRDELHVVAGHEHRVPVGGQGTHRRRERSLGGVVQPARRLVEQQHARPGRQHQGERERQALALGEVARVRVVGYAGDELVQDPPAPAPVRGTLAVAGSQLLGHGLEVEQVRGVLREQPDQGAALRRGPGRGVGDDPLAAYVDGAGEPRAGALECPQQGGLAGAIAAHQCRDPAGR